MSNAQTEESPVKKQVTISPLETQITKKKTIDPLQEEIADNTEENFDY